MHSNPGIHINISFHFTSNFIHTFQINFKGETVFEIKKFTHIIEEAENNSRCIHIPGTCFEMLAEIWVLPPI